MNNLSIPALIAIIVLCLILLACVPLLLIWSLNTLFGLGVAYSFKTWLATLVLAGAVGGASKL